MDCMELQVLRFFQTVAAGVTVTDTAAEAHLTQSALSRALSRLEHEVGAELFQRVGRTLRLTPAGQTFKEHVDAVLHHYDLGLRAVAEAVDPEAGLIPLAFLHTLGTWLIPPLLSGFRDRFPRSRFALHQHGESGINQGLLDGTVDLAITSGEPDTPLISWQRLLVEPLLLVVPPRHRLARRKQARLSDVADEPFILLQPGYGLRTTTERLCLQAGFTPHVGFEGEEVETVRGLVSAGLGVSLLPLPQMATLPRSAAEPTTPYLKVTDVDCARDIGVARLTGRALPPASERFLQHVLSATPRIPPGRLK
jgi:DNA-binding transcriptional LysR family regulator